MDGHSNKEDDDCLTFVVIPRNLVNNNYSVFNKEHICKSKPLSVAWHKENIHLTMINTQKHKHLILVYENIIWIAMTLDYSSSRPIEEAQVCTYSD